MSMSTAETQLEKKLIALIQLRDRIDIELQDMRKADGNARPQRKRIRTVQQEYDYVQAEIIRLDAEENELAQLRIARRGFE